MCACHDMIASLEVVRLSFLVCLHYLDFLSHRYISKMYFCHQESLGVWGSCRTRILQWSNLGVACLAVAFRCTWELWRQMCKGIRGLVTILGAPRNAGDKVESTLECRRRAWEYVESLESNLGKPTYCVETLLVYLEIVGTTHR